MDSLVIFTLDKEDPDVLIVNYSCHTEGGNQIVATRKFRRCKTELQSRKISVI